jgi:hypothetical protein
VVEDSRVGRSGIVFSVIIKRVRWWYSHRLKAGMNRQSYRGMIYSLGHFLESQTPLCHQKAKKSIQRHFTRDHAWVAAGMAWLLTATHQQLFFAGYFLQRVDVRS